jgi:hypothetical protein
MLPCVTSTSLQVYKGLQGCNRGIEGCYGMYKTDTGVYRGVLGFIGMYRGESGYMGVQYKSYKCVIGV